VDIGAEDIPGLIEFAKSRMIDLVVVGPEVPIALGIRDAFDGVGVNCFAPKKKAAFLEASKMKAKAFLSRHGIPTAYYGAFSNFKSALGYAQGQDYPLVIKADGLAAGKGVSIVGSPDEARDVIEQNLIAKRFGTASEAVLIEECLVGKELSVFCVTDGSAWKIIGCATDYKRQLSGDQGPNTGGMGSISPVPFMDPGQFLEVVNRIVKPTFRGFKSEGLLYEGVLYFGVIWTEIGPKVLEFNVRFGDPETQVLVPLFDFDFLELLLRTVDGTLADFPVEVKDEASVGVILASGGYPGSYEKEKEIHGLPDAFAMDDVTVFHAGTRMDDDRIVTSGGRVLAVVGTGIDLAGARARAYKGVGTISFDGMQYRDDIGTSGI
jgi:phosphoribosylamine--glycine ligase